MKNFFIPDIPSKARISSPEFLMNLILSLFVLLIFVHLFSTELQAQDLRYSALLQKYTKLGESDKIQILMDSRNQNLTVKELFGMLKNNASLTVSEKSVYQDMLKDISSDKSADILNIRTKLSSAKVLSSEQSTIAKSKLTGESVLTEHEYFGDFGGGFVIHELYKYSYDNSFNMIQDELQTYDSTAGWVNNARWIYSYDSFNRDTLEINEGWDPGSQSWVSYARLSNTYDVNNNLLYTFNSQWADPEWVLWARYLYTYDVNNNNLERLSQISSGSDWVNDSRETFTYDANNNLLSDIYETWNGTAWQVFTKFEKTYDVNNNETSNIFSIFGNYSSKDIYTYDSNSNQISDSNYTWNSNSWVTYFVQTNTFDVMNNLIHYLVKLLNGSALEDYLQYDATFNASNNITTWSSYTRDAGNWVPRRKAEYSYDADQNLTLVMDSSSNNGGLTWRLFIQDRYIWGSGVTGIEDDNILPSAFELSQNYPNPFNPSTLINFTIPNKAYVSLKVFDLLGSQVAELFNGDMEAGNHSIEFNAANLTSGIYFYRIQSDNFSGTKKMILLK